MKPYSKKDILQSDTPIKVLNLYAGVGGNRKLWDGNIQITAIENNESIAEIYKHLYPKDNVIITDAHEYLLNNFKNYDFIWSSPPCQSHSKLNFSSRSRGNGGKHKYIDMSLYQEIVLLQSFFKGKYVVENVKAYYDPLIKPQISGRHYFWANFKIPNLNYQSKVRNEKGNNLIQKMNDRNIHITDFKSYKGDKRQLLNNCVEPEIGLEIFKSALSNNNCLQYHALFH